MLSEWKIGYNDSMNKQIKQYLELIESRSKLSSYEMDEILEKATPLEVYSAFMALSLYFREEEGANLKNLGCYGVPFSPSFELTDNLIEKLVLGGLVYPAPVKDNIGNISPIEYAKDEIAWTDTSVYNYDLMKTIFTPNFDEAINPWVVADKICNKVSVSRFGKKEIKNFWKEIAYNELLEYLLFRLEEEKLYNEESVTLQIKASIREITESFSVSQGFKIIDLSIKEMIERIRKKDVFILQSYNYLPLVLGSICEQKRGVNFKGTPRPEAIKQSVLSRFFFANFLHIGELGFRIAPNDTLIEELIVKAKTKVNKSNIDEEILSKLDIGELKRQIQKDSEFGLLLARHGSNIKESLYKAIYPLLKAYSINGEVINNLKKEINEEIDSVFIRLERELESKPSKKIETKAQKFSDLDGLVKI